MGKTIIVSSHILPELADFCNKVGIFEKGKMLISGSVEEIVQRLRPHRLLSIKVLGDATALEPTLLRVPNIANIRYKDSVAELEFQGTLEDQVEILHRLIVEGHRIASFAETSMDLEEVFMQVTHAGAVQ